MQPYSRHIKPYYDLERWLTMLADLQEHYPRTLRKTMILLQGSDTVKFVKKLFGVSPFCLFSYLSSSKTKTFIFHLPCRIFSFLILQSVGDQIDVVRTPRIQWKFQVNGSNPTLNISRNSNASSSSSWCLDSPSSPSGRPSSARTNNRSQALANLQSMCSSATTKGSTKFTIDSFRELFAKPVGITYVRIMVSFVYICFSPPIWLCNARRCISCFSSCSMTNQREVWCSPISSISLMKSLGTL